MKYFFVCCAAASFAFAGGHYVKIFPSGPSDLHTLTALHLDVYARMEDAYVGILSDEQIDLLQQSGVRCQRIAPATSAGELYIVTPPAELTIDQARLVLAGYAGVLFHHAGSFFVAGNPQLMEQLPGQRFHITHVNRRPMVLGESFLPEPAGPPKYNAVVQWVINQITPGELARFVRDLSGENPVVVGGRTDTIRSRYTYNVKNSVALKYYYEKAQSYGVDSVIYHRFSQDSNVIATRIGRVYPRQQYLIGGHVDDVPNSGNAPGADDNATGTIAGLIAAKYIRNIPFKRTIKFVAWNAEEQGLIGSDYYASEAAARGDSIKGYLNGDMIGFETSNMDYIWCYNANRPGSIVISSKFTQMNTDYSLGLRVRISTQAPAWSDMYSFWINGYDAICNIENDNNPYYHTSNDRIGTLDTVYFCKVVKCMVATLLELAEPDTVFQDVEEEDRSELAGRSFVIRPNPARRVVQFAVNPPVRKTAEISVYDVTGKLVRPARTISDGSPVSIELPAGVYFAECRLDGSTLTKKFVILE